MTQAVVFIDQGVRNVRTKSDWCVGTAGTSVTPSEDGIMDVRNKRRR